MIHLTRLNKKKFMLNNDLIETIEANPDTVVSLRNGKIYIVTETPEEIYDMVFEYRRELYRELLGLVPPHKGIIDVGNPRDVIDEVVDAAGVDELEDGAKRR
jgi:flagellar protein FlbD